MCVIYFTPCVALAPAFRPLFLFLPLFPPPLSYLSPTNNTPLDLRAVPVQSSWIPTSVGFLRQDKAIYECPVYVTTFRGPTYVFLATLKTQEPPSKWIMAGCALALQEDD